MSTISGTLLRDRAAQLANDADSPVPVAADLTFDSQPMLLVAIHTEEEFDWSADFKRDAMSVSHMREIGRAQDLFEAAGVRPTYLVDQAIIASEEAASRLRTFQQQRRAEIGAHLHPWVSPPHDEALSAYNSYPGNLPAAMESAKLRALTNAIRTSFGSEPRIYLAGRHGYGRNTANILRSLGYTVDLSAVAHTDYSADGGPDYSSVGNEAFWDPDEPQLLRIPHTCGYVGFMCGDGRPDPRLDVLALRRTRIGRSLLAHSGAARRVRLTPEGFSDQQMMALTRALHRGGVRCFLLSFHSPSIVPGFTPYVRDKGDLERFMSALRNYLAFFSQELGGRFVTPLEVRDAPVVLAA